MFPEKASIFTELGKLCDKVAVYSLKIAGEAEKVPCADGSVMRMLNDDNSAWNLRNKALLDCKRLVSPLSEAGSYRQKQKSVIWSDRQTHLPCH